MSWWVGGKEDQYVVAAGTVRFIFCRCYLVIRVKLIGALWRWYRLIIFLSLLSFLSLCDERIERSVCCRRRVCPFSLLSLLTLCASCRADCFVTTLLPTGSILLFIPFLYIRDELLGVLLPLCRQFYLFFNRLGNLCREAHCGDAAVIRQFSPFSLLSSCYFMKSWSVRRCRGYRQFFSFIFL